MKKLLSFYVIMLLFSCSNDENNLDEFSIDIPLGTISADIDGIETRFSVDSGATVELVDWDFYQTALKISILGYANSEKSKNILVWFFVVPVKEIYTGTYPDLDKQIYHFLEFNNMFRGEILNWGSNRSLEDYRSTATITRIDSVLQGKFQGIVAIGGGPSTDGPDPPLTYKVENGIFNVKLENWDINRRAD